MPVRATIEAIYGMIVTQAREPLFYRDLGVPDTTSATVILPGKVAAAQLKMSLIKLCELSFE